MIITMATMATAIVIPLSPGIIIKRQLSHRRNIPEREKRQIIQSVVAVRARHREHPTVRVTRVVHETRGRAEFLPVHDVDVVVVDEEIQSEEIGVAVVRGGDVFAYVGCFLGDYFAQVAVDELAGADEVGGAEACIFLAKCVLLGYVR